MWVRGQRHAPAALPPGKRPGKHCIGGWVGTKVSLDGRGKSRLPPGFDPRTFQPVASRYTDCSIARRSVYPEIQPQKVCFDLKLFSPRHGQ